jgi:L-ascorbate metabolism protein UlaG (beta-lactamase superfamily)
MKDEHVYLKPNVVFEPLICNWYAWPHLISPGTASRIITDRLMKIMNSYIRIPQVHAAAVKNPKMRGGPFIDLNGERVEEIIELQEQTRQSQSKLFELSEAIHELGKMLKTHVNGYSLNPLYEKVPDILRGFVELVYDLNNNPSFRFIEPLLYREFYDEASQSVAIWLIDNDERPFMFSTPKLPDAKVLQLKIPFSHSTLDELVKTKRIAQSFSYLQKLLNIKEKDIKLFETFFTKESPPAYKKYAGEQVRLRYFGHACILLETKNISILVDPLSSYDGYHSEIDHFKNFDLPEKIDYILISYNHQNCISIETLIQLRYKVKSIIVPRNSGGDLQDPNLKLMLNKIGFHNVIELDELETIKTKNCNITGLPFMGRHGDLDIKSKICYHLEIGNFSTMFLSNSCNVEPRLYEHIQKVVGNVNVLFMGMDCNGAPLSWEYGPLLLESLSRDEDQSRRLSASNYVEGISIVDVFKPKEVYVYALGQEPWVEYISSIILHDDSEPIIASNKLIAECKKRELKAERLFGRKELLYNIDME